MRRQGFNGWYELVRKSTGTTVKAGTVVSVPGGGKIQCGIAPVSEGSLGTVYVEAENGNDSFQASAESFGFLWSKLKKCGGCGQPCTGLQFNGPKHSECRKLLVD